MNGQRVYYEEDNAREIRDISNETSEENLRPSSENESERLGKAEYFKGEGNKHMAAQVRYMTLVILIMNCNICTSYTKHLKSVFNSFLKSSNKNQLQSTFERFYAHTDVRRNTWRHMLRIPRQSAQALTDPKRIFI